MDSILEIFGKADGSKTYLLAVAIAFLAVMVFTGQVHLTYEEQNLILSLAGAGALATLRHGVKKLEKKEEAPGA